jgi:hypothetical protein
MVARRVLLVALLLPGCRDSVDFDALDREQAETRAKIKADAERMNAGARPNQAPTVVAELPPAKDDTPGVEIPPPAATVTRPATKEDAKEIYAELSDLLKIGSGELARVRQRMPLGDLDDAQRCGKLMHGSGVAAGTVARAKAVRERADALPRSDYLDLVLAAADIQFCVTCADWADENCRDAKEALRKAKKSLR